MPSAELAQALTRKHKMSTYVQEVIVTVSDGSRFIVYISNAKGSPQFALEVYWRDPQFSLSRVDALEVHASAEAAFDAAIVVINSYLTKVSANMLTINSPCNDPFVKKLVQAKVLRRYGISVSPTVNGN